VSFGFDYSRQREDREYMNSLGLKFSVPLQLWNRNQGRVAYTRAGQQRAAATVAALALSIATEVREAQARVTGLAAIVEHTRGAASEVARKNTELIEQTYASGTTPFLTILESRRQQLMIQQNAAETEEKFAAAVTDWELRTAHLPTQIQSVSTRTKTAVHHR
jgi:outer membrane protein TolC